jgi:iron complex transport system substrate-binding protein
MSSRRSVASFAIFAIALVASACAGGGDTGDSPDAEAISENESDGTGDEESGEQPVAAADAEEPGEVRLVAHALGETEVPATVARVVTLDQAATEALVALGVTPVGSGSQGNELGAQFGAAVDALPIAADIENVGPYGEPDLERILALDPDLIIGEDWSMEAVYDQLSEIAPTVAVAYFATDGTWASEWEDHLRTIADLLGRPELADEAFARYDQLLADFRSSIDVDPSGTAVSVVGFGGDAQAYYQTGLSFQGKLLMDAGFARPEAQRTQETDRQYVSPERIPELDGDIILLLSPTVGGGEEPEQQDAFVSNPLWANLTAVQQDQVHVVDENLWKVAGSVLSAEALLADLSRVLAS